MTVNAISDIHASQDKNGKIIYNLPFRFPESDYIESFNTLKKYFEDNADTLSKLPISRKESAWERGQIVCKSFKSMMEMLEKADKIIKNREVSGKSNCFHSIWKVWRALKNIDTFLYENSVKWFPKTSRLKVRSVEDIADYVRKLGCNFDPSKLKKADYLIIAGDLGVDNIYNDVLKDIEEKTKGKFKKILHIAGNHDHWWFGDERINPERNPRPEHVNLEHDYFEFSDGDYLFLGCTMWTPLRGYGETTVGRTMNDYRYTPNFTTSDSSKQYEIQSTWLRSKIEANKDKKIVVFTHHQPFKELIDSDYKHSDVNAAYVVMDGSMDDIGKYGNIKLWVCGHSHSHTSMEKNGVKVVRNPIGYRDHYGLSFPEVDPKYWYNNVYTI